MDDVTPRPDSGPSAEYAPGAVLDGKYRLESVLGTGGMGVVWLATHLGLEARVAVKMIRPELAQDELVIHRMLCEARAAAQLRGQHVVRVLDVARLPSGAPYLVLEYLEGNDLFEQVATHGPIAVDEAVDWMLQACEALAEAHATGIVHRDLKPENLFLAVQPDGSRALKILDFGVSKRLQGEGQGDRRATQDGCIVGSPNYMAPEQVRGWPTVDPRADIWSLGAILYELVTGVCPFDAGSVAEICRMVMAEPPPPMRTFRPDLPEELEQVILRCLEKDRERRYASVDALARDLAAFGSGRALARAVHVTRIAERTSLNCWPAPAPFSAPALGSDADPPLRRVDPIVTEEPSLQLGAVSLSVPPEPLRPARARRAGRAALAGGSALALAVAALIARPHLTSASNLGARAAAPVPANDVQAPARASLVLESSPARSAPTAVSAPTARSALRVSPAPTVSSEPEGDAPTALGAAVDRTTPPRRANEVTPRPAARARPAKAVERPSKPQPARGRAALPRRKLAELEFAPDATASARVKAPELVAPAATANTAAPSVAAFPEPAFDPLERRH